MLEELTADRPVDEEEDDGDNGAAWHVCPSVEVMKPDGHEHSSELHVESKMTEAPSTPQVLSVHKTLSIALAAGAKQSQKPPASSSTPKGEQSGVPHT